MKTHRLARLLIVAPLPRAFAAANRSTIHRSIIRLLDAIPVLTFRAVPAKTGTKPSFRPLAWRFFVFSGGTV